MIHNPDEIDMMDADKLRTELRKTVSQLTKYRKCINKIDDYLEYRFQSQSTLEVRNYVLSYIDDLTKSL